MANPPLIPKDFPPLIIEDSERTGARLSSDFRILELERRSNLHTKLLFGVLERDIVLAAEEILKWSIQKTGQEIGDCRQFYDTRPSVKAMVLMVCRPYGVYEDSPSSRDSEAFKVILRR